MISSAARGYAAGTVERQVQRQPDILKRYGGDGFNDLSGDTQLRLLHLAEALAVARPALFDSYLAWLKVAQAARGMPLDDLIVNLECMRDELGASLPAGQEAMATDYIGRAIPAVQQAPTELPSLLEETSPHIDLARRYLLAVLETRRQDAIALVVDAVESGVSVPEIHQHVVVRTQAEIGRMWQMGEIHVGEEHLGTATANQVLAELRNRMPRAERTGRRVLCTTVSGDLHDLAIQVVADHFEMNGWDAIPLGPSMPAVDLVHALRDFEAHLLAISASAPLQVRTTAELIRVVREHAPTIPILVGGTAYNTVDDLWQVVGADGMASDAASGFEVGERLVSPVA